MYCVALQFFKILGAWCFSLQSECVCGFKMVETREPENDAGASAEEVLANRRKSEAQKALWKQFVRGHFEKLAAKGQLNLPWAKGCNWEAGQTDALRRPELNKVESTSKVQIAGTSKENKSPKDDLLNKHVFPRGTLSNRPHKESEEEEFQIASPSQPIQAQSLTKRASNVHKKSQGTKIPKSSVQTRAQAARTRLDHQADPMKTRSRVGSEIFLNPLMGLSMKGSFGPRLSVRAQDASAGKQKSPDNKVTADPKAKQNEVSQQPESSSLWEPESIQSENKKTLYSEIVKKGAEEPMQPGSSQIDKSSSPKKTVHFNVQKTRHYSQRATRSA